MAPTGSSSTEDFTSEVLLALSKADPILSAETFPEVPFESLKAAFDRLASRSMITYEQIERQEAFLEPEAEVIVSHGSHEARVFEAVHKAMGGLSIQELEAEVGDRNVTKVGQGKAFKEKWIKKEDNRLVALVDSINDVTRDQLRTIQETRTHDSKILADLKKRKLLTVRKAISFKISKGPKFALEMVKEETDLTADMLTSGSWKTATFKPYNFKALGADQHAGALHPLNKMRHEFRQIFFETGFTEMPTNQYIESGFWNFDALFVPQKQHPARDLQDTFYISDPKKADLPGPVSADDKQDYAKYLESVKQVHENGKFGSIGYRYPWAEEESLRLVLRTHTTSVSAAMLSKLASENPGGRCRPARYFSIDRVFRNESVDATHLCEFHQVEGVIADYGLTLGGLMEFMEQFFNKMGITDLKFKPAGMFRPEMLEAMGLPRDLRVFGFGLSLERPTMIKYAISNIRELLGHQVDLNFIEKNAAVRLDKD
ncbi:hypothetical protein G7Z17_g7512 [Cylindrodendrum hubeiense]|uniref:phenylalanine--tRNA ligase n=1 Tax=Cylindrodendrum hubeiense TaxID=595255 RepID=A0A9P5L7B9_9HYPO|nr:hypothetical protein G7Z17_g7512 [Cylindrodendrum hubeiense]